MRGGRAARSHLRGTHRSEGLQGASQRTDDRVSSPRTRLCVTRLGSGLGGSDGARPATCQGLVRTVRQQLGRRRPRRFHPARARQARVCASAAQLVTTLTFVRG